MALVRSREDIALAKGCLRDDDVEERGACLVKPTPRGLLGVGFGGKGADEDLFLFFLLNSDIRVPSKCSKDVTRPSCQIKYNMGCPVWETTSRQGRWDVYLGLKS